MSSDSSNAETPRTLPTKLDADRYFNTVGSKEGWTPSTFVSSRKNRIKDANAPAQQQRREDFMDEEDLRDEEEARQLQTSGDFMAIGSTADDPTRYRDPMDIFRPTGDTVGVRLMKRMGWKEGQGIGPKVRRKANLGGGEGDDGEIHLFAPEPTPLISIDVSLKDNRKGLEPIPRSARIGNDYSDEEDDTGVSSGPRLSIARSKPQKQKQQKRGGFGVGVLNDTGSDDEDPYDMGPKISYNRFIEGSKKSGARIGKSSRTKPTIKSSNPLLNSKPVFISKKVAPGKGKSGFRKCHDGRLPLDGFILGNHIEDFSQARQYDPPPIPEGWKSSKSPSTTRDTSGYVSTADAARASKMDPKSRGKLLGEEQLPGKSVFDYMTPEARERIAKATGRTDLPPALNEKAPEGYEVPEQQKRKDIWDLVPKLNKDVATQALNRGVGGWMPYAEDEAKRNRYRSFLQVQAGITSGFPDRAVSATTDEWIAELREFARAADVFKPISGLMASRFTSSTIPAQNSSSDPSLDSSTENLLRKPSKPEDPAEAAARVGMFGPMTRSTQPFSPTRLLCKRFNVRVPTTSTGDEAAPDRKSGVSGGQHNEPDSTTELVSKETMSQLLIESARKNGQKFVPPESTDPESKQPGQQQPPQLPPAVSQEVVIDPERNEALEGERPGEAVFKAIFGSDDEE